ncbi:hypothetical protein RhiirA5_435568 [Rhizophagus irregularis]|uniref:Uncharacterized protein n=1 Tax=Rhizophagus irregularis TaxID=588596 RepID=A0A2N0NN92_9GLOM|nr:hypothetical protein RhiirA5_435568 [Rhizophagus irregularis]
MIRSANCINCIFLYEDFDLLAAVHTTPKQEDYQQALDSYSYSCGAPIFPDDHYLKELK